MQSEQDLRPSLRNAALEFQPWIEAAPLILTLYTCLADLNAAFAEQAPLGLRGERYAFIEAGAIAQTLSLVAAEAVLGSVLVAGYDDQKTAQVQGTEMRPLLHMCFGLPL